MFVCLHLPNSRRVWCVVQSYWSLWQVLLFRTLPSGANYCMILIPSSMTLYTVKRWVSLWESDKIKLFCLCPCRENLLLWQGLCSEALLLHTQWNSLHEWMYICSIVQSFFNISVKLILPWCWKRYLLRTQCWIVHHFVLYCQLKNWHTPGDGSFLQRWIQ